MRERVWVWTRLVFVYWVAVPAAWIAFVLLVVWLLAGGSDSPVPATGSDAGYDWGTANEGPPGP